MYKIPPVKASAARENVRIGELKAHLSECLRAVEAGGTITVYDRNRAVARIVPCADVRSPLSVRRGVGRASDIPLPTPTKRRKRKPRPTSLEILLADRRSGR